MHLTDCGVLAILIVTNPAFNNRGPLNPKPNVFIPMTESQTPDLRERIRRELKNLTSAFENNPDRLGEVIAAFVRETPDFLTLLEKHIGCQEWQSAAALVHKIKTRYGYLGLDDLSKQLDHWEKQLTFQPTSSPNSNILDNLKRMTSEIIDELEHSPLYAAEQKPDATKLPLSGKSVLIAEDDEINAMVFDLFIRETGASTLVASDGASALELAMSKKPDLVFMDVHMPFFSGIDAIRELRARGYACPIVSLSASTRLNEQQNSLDAGANDFIIKPVNREAILKILHKYLGDKASTSEEA